MESEQWSCSICLRFLYKPVANFCGHMFCFWCHHQAMSPFSESTCPLCRKHYQQFPAIAWKIDSFLSAYHPDEYLKRKEETEQEEEHGEFRSPSRKLLSPAVSRPGHPQSEDFTCDCCHKLLYGPVVLNCGHLVCSFPCLDKGEHSNYVVLEDRKEEASIRPETCPWDRRRKPQPTVCRLVEDFIIMAFPEEYKQRKDEVEKIIEKNVLQDNVEDITERIEISEPDEQASLPVIEHEEVDGGVGNENSNERGSTQHVPVTAENALLMSWVRGETDNYPHFGIGCDVCGQYPIIGKRYKCLDCPEASGFDVCGPCFDLGSKILSSTISGRFGQMHQPSHKMEEIRPRITSLHLLKAANPDLTMDQLLNYLNLSIERSESRQETDNGQGMEQEQQQLDELEEEPNRTAIENSNLTDNYSHRVTSNSIPANVDRLTNEADRESENGDTATEEIAFGLRRGPRPAPDSSAQWPSPSEPHN